MAKADDLTDRVAQRTLLHEETKAKTLKVRSRGGKMKASLACLRSLRPFALLAFVLVGGVQTPSLLGQNAPFSSSQAYHDMLASLGEKVVHPSRIGAGDLVKGPLPTVPVEQVETSESLVIESSLWRLEVGKNPWKLSLLNKVTHAAWNIASGAAGPTGIRWTDLAGKRVAMQLLQVEKTQRSGNHWTIDCRVEGANELATLRVDAISLSVIRLSIEAPGSNEQKLRIGLTGQGPFFGLGERFTQAKLDGLKVNLHPEDNWDTSITPGHNWTYAPVPFLLTPHGLGLYIDTARISDFDFSKAQSGEFTIQVNGPTADCYFLLADGPKAVISAYTSLTGRTPLSPPWVFGVWVCALKGRDTVLNVARRLRQEGIPASALWVYDVYDIPGNMVAPQGETGYYGPPREFTGALHQMGFKVLWYVKPYVFPILTPYFSPNPDFEEGVRRDFFVKTANGEPIGPDYPLIEGSKHVVSADLDFTAPAAVDWWQKKIQVALKDYDFDGWMEDYGEYVNEEYQFAAGRNAGRDMANLYTLFYHKLTFLIANQLKPDAVGFARSGYAGSQGYSRVIWGGDQAGDWTATRGLASVIPAGITAGLSGFAVWGPDIDCAGSSKELFARWTEFGAMTPVMRTHAWGMPNFSVDIWFDSQTIDIFRRYAKLHVSLWPYFYTYATQAAKDGLPIMRHLMLDWPDDSQAYDAENEYLLGDKILVAPVFTEGARTRALYLPKGSWVDYWTGDIIQGGSQVEVQAPLERIPIFVKSGSLIPMDSGETETLASDLAANKYRTIGNRLIWRVFPATGSSRASFTLSDGSRAVVEQEPGRIHLRGTQSPVVKAYEVVMSAQTLPNRVHLNGRSLTRLDDGGYHAGKEGWWFNADDRLLHVLFTADNFELITIIRP